MDVRRGLGALAVALLLLSGCGDDDSTADPPEPTISGSPSPTATRTPSGPVEPELPKAATTYTPAGAIAFTKHYWAMVDYAQASGDLRTLRALSGSGCGPCTGGIRALERIDQRGGMVKGDAREVRVTKARLGSMGLSSTAAEVFFQVHLPRQVEFYGTDDRRNKVQKATSFRAYFFLLWTAEKTWRVVHWGSE